MRGRVCAVVRTSVRIMACGLFLLLAFIGTAGTAGAVTFIEQANRLQLIYAALLDLRPGQSPNPVDNSAWSLALELIPQPDVDTRVGAKLR